MLVLGRRFWSVGSVSAVSSSDHQSVGETTYEALGTVGTKHLYKRNSKSRCKVLRRRKVWCFNKKDKNKTTQSALWLTPGLRTDAISLGRSAECSMRVLSKCRLKILRLRAYCVALGFSRRFQPGVSTLKRQTNSSIRCTGFHARHVSHEA
jgi:hypothetical protein